jgi:hypothetical protein
MKSIFKRNAMAGWQAWQAWQAGSPNTKPLKLPQNEKYG